MVVMPLMPYVLELPDGGNIVEHDDVLTLGADSPGVSTTVEAEIVAEFYPEEVMSGCRILETKTLNTKRYRKANTGGEEKPERRVSNE